jgi:hypothetical protein
VISRSMQCDAVAFRAQKCAQRIERAHNGITLCQLHRLRLNLALEYLQSWSNISAVGDPALARTQPVVFLSPIAPYRSTPLHLTTHPMRRSTLQGYSHEQGRSQMSPPPQQEWASNEKSKATKTESFARWPLAAR